MPSLLHVAAEILFLSVGIFAIWTIGVTMRDAFKEK
jgi:hypothetical protein